MKWPEVPAMCWTPFLTVSHLERLEELGLVEWGSHWRHGLRGTREFPSLLPSPLPAAVSGVTLLYCVIPQWWSTWPLTCGHLSWPAWSCDPKPACPPYGPGNPSVSFLVTGPWLTQPSMWILEVATSKFWKDFIGRGVWEEREEGNNFIVL